MDLTLSHHMFLSFNENEFKELMDKYNDYKSHLPFPDDYDLKDYIEDCIFEFCYDNLENVNLNKKI